TRWKLTTSDGRSYVIDEFAGLQSISDVNNNTLSYGPDGITSNHGVGVTIERDGANRVSAVVDPAGERITYDYDSAGDLVQITDRNGEVTRLVYGDPDRPHFLTKAVDNRGTTLWEVRIDPATGRLAQIATAGGTPASLSYDFGVGQLPPDHYLQTQTVKGVPTEMVFDADGNLVRKVQRVSDPLNPTSISYLVNVFEYDAAGNQTKASDVFAVTDPAQRFTYLPSPVPWLMHPPYEPAGHPLTVTDAMNRTSTFTYDDNGRVLTSTNAAGHVTGTTYDARGNVSAKYQDGVLTLSNTYNDFGQVLTSANGDEVVFASYVYDNKARMLSMTDGAGVSYNYS